MFDLIEPGETSVTEIFKGLHSISSTSVLECKAALEAQYMPFHGVGLRVTVKINERITMEIINKNMMHMHISANRPYVYYHPLFTFSHMRYDATGCPQRSKGVCVK